MNEDVNEMMRGVIWELAGACVEHDLTTDEHTITDGLTYEI